MLPQVAAPYPQMPVPISSIRAFSTLLVGSRPMLLFYLCWANGLMRYEVSTEQTLGGISCSLGWDIHRSYQRR
ncbi:uncharacterized protein J3R85_020581 [Psidium guajava]|nr:uncharacterized protein J3R85_020581 [Psidium guajava]